MADYTQPDVVPKRVRFFDGQFLQEQDFIDEQKFHLDRERRQSRMLRLTGISAGLTVASEEQSQITVTAGMAVDSLGRHLVLAADTTVPLGEGFDGQQDIEVHLVYREAATDRTPAGTPGGAGSRRWDESPSIVVIAPDGTTTVAPDDASPDPDGPTVLLTRLAVAGNGEVTVDLTAAQRSTLSVAGALGVGTADPGSDLEIGDYGPQDRHLTFKVAGDDAYRSGIRLWAGSEDEYAGYSLEYDQRPVEGQGLHVRTHGPTDPEGGTTRLFVTPDGDVGIGTTAPAKDGWATRVVDVVGAGNTKLSVRTGNIEGIVAAHDTGEAGMFVGTTSANPLTLATDSWVRLGITADGDVGIGTTAPANDGEWGRVVDVKGAGSTKLSVRTAWVEGVVLAHDTGVFGAQRGMVVGTASANPLTFVTGGAARLVVSDDVAIGSEASPSRLTVRAEHNHLQLRRELIPSDEDNKHVFLELLQSDQEPHTLSPTSFNIRFQHSHTFWHRLEVTADGFHFRDGELSSNEYRDIHAARVTASELRIGEVTIGEAELAVLKKLAAGELTVDIFSPRLSRYAYAGNKGYSEIESDPHDRNFVFAIPSHTPEYTSWILKAPR